MRSDEHRFRTIPCPSRGGGLALDQEYARRLPRLEEASGSRVSVPDNVMLAGANLKRCPVVLPPKRVTDTTMPLATLRPLARSRNTAKSGGE